MKSNSNEKFEKLLRSVIDFFKASYDYAKKGKLQVEISIKILPGGKIIFLSKNESRRIEME